MEETHLSVSKAFEMAKQANEEDKIDVAKSLCEAILKTSPNNSDALHLLGLISMKQGNSKEAEKLIGRALRVNPTQSSFYHDLGLAHQKQNDLASAIDCYKKAIRTSPLSSKPYTDLASALKETGQLSDAISYYNQAIQLNENSSFLHNQLGKTYSAIGLTDEARNSYFAAMKICPDELDAFYNLGMAQALSGKPEDALTLFEEALKRKPLLPEAFQQMGMIHHGLGRLEKGLELFGKALELEPNSDRIRCHIGETLLALGRAEEAEAILNITQTNDFSSPQVDFLLSLLHGNVKDPIPDDYIREHFDEYAECWESSSERIDASRTSKKLRQLLETLKQGNMTFRNAIDLGCGSGISGLEFKPISERLTGLDLSPKMAAKAMQKNIYDDLRVENFSDFLKVTYQKFDLFYTSGAFSFYGNLEPIFNLIRERCSPGAWFAFTLEHSEKEGYHMKRNGRFAHSPSYIKKLVNAMGFVEFGHPWKLRKEQGDWVQGNIFVLKSPIR